MTITEKRNRYCIVDVETNTFQKGNPFSKCGKLVVIGLHSNKYSLLLHTSDQNTKKVTQTTVDHSELLVGFNIKFDLHWIKRLRIDFSKQTIWDCQLAHFLLTAQSKPFPSLNDVCEYYGLPKKLDIVKTEYWDKGIDTEDIPTDILEEYLTGDLVLTEKVYHHQLEDFKKNPTLYKLFRLQCDDLKVLQEMEYNGMYFDTDTAATLAEAEESKIKSIEEELQKGYEEIPINFQSRDHLSCYLYGGTITHESRMPIGVYKTGPKTGHTRFKKVEYKFNTPQLVSPPKEAALAKEGYYATDDQTLRNLRCSKAIRKRIDLILERSKSSKLVGTYYRGIPELIAEMDWPSSTVHGQFNQCVAATGRLSSSRPNLQNFAGEVDKLLKTRYG